MTTKKIHIVLIAAFMLTACTENLSEERATEGLSFSVSINDNELATRSDVVTDEEATAMPAGLYLHTVTEPRTVSKETRAQLIEGETFPTTESFGVSGYRYTSSTPLSNATPNFYYNAEVTHTGTKWVSSQSYYIPTSTEKLAFYAYYPYDATATNLSSNTANGPLTVSYTVNTADITQQTDLMTASATELTYHSGPDYRVPLTFKHALTAIRIELGEDVTPGYVRKVSLLSVGLNGRHTAGGGWAVTSKGNLEVDFTNGNTTDGYDTNTATGITALLANEKTILMIPQAFASNDEDACLYFEINDGTRTHEFYYHLNGTTWAAGTMVTYRINTQSINVVHPVVNYPSDWGGEAFAFSDYRESGDTIGVYAVDNTGKVAIANAYYAYDGTTWKQKAGADSLFYHSDYEYFAYYPYRSTLTGAPTAGTTVGSGLSASTFFSSVVSNWQVSTDQSTADKLLANDLQISKGMTSTTSRSRVNFDMEHQMGLAGVNLSSKSVTGTIKYYLTTDENYTWTVTGSATIKASSAVESKQLYSKTDLLYYYITKAGQTTDFKCQKENNNSDWKQDYSLTIARGQYDSFTAETATPTGVVENRGWTLKPGDVYFSDGALGTTTSSYGTSKTAVGIVLSTSTSTTDTNAGYKHGYVVSAKNVGGPNNAYKWGNNNNTDTGNGYVATDNKYTSVQADLDGRTKCNRIKNLSNYSNDNYTAVYQALNFNVPLSGSSSGWFLSTSGLFDLWIRTTSVDANGNGIMGSFNTYSTAGGGGFYFSGSVSTITSNMNKYFTDRGFVDGSTFHRIAWSTAGSYCFWMVSEYNVTTPYFVDFYRTRLNYPRDIKRANANLRLRPFLVF